MFRIKPVALAVFAAGAAQSVLAQQVTTLPEVKVTAAGEASSLTAPGIDAAKAALRRTPGGVDVVDAESYKEGRTSTLQDALQDSPGVFVQSRFGAEEARVSIRGSGIQRTFHGRGLKLMQDGVPVNLADGSFDMQAIEPMAARYVEVWRGANALQYGASTLGGAINFVSPTGHDAEAARLRGEAGSFGYRRVHAAVGGVAGDFDGYLSASSFEQDGFRDHARQRAQRLVGNAGWRINRDLETRFYFGYADSDSELPGSLTKAQLKADPRQAAAGNITGDQKRDLTVARLANKTTLRLSPETRMEFSAYYSDKTLFHPIFQVLDQNNDDYGLEFRLVSEARLAGRRNTFVFGVAPSWGETDEKRWVNVGGRRGAARLFNHQEASNLDIYAENQHYLNEQWVLIAGAQATRAKRQLSVDYSFTGLDRGFDRSFRGVSPKLGVRYEASPRVQVYANLSKSYEPPSFGEMSTTLNAVTANLKGQRATTFEIGSRGRSGDWSWDASYYYGRLQDELLSYSLGGGLTATINADRTLHQGVELGATWRITPQLELREAYMWNDFRFRDDATYGGNRLAGVPQHLSRTTLTWRGGNGFYVAGTVEWSPQRYAIDLANTYYADRYAVWSLRAGQQVAKELSWFVEGRNLANKRYAATTGVIIDAAGIDRAQFLPGDGRAFYAGLEWKF